MKVYKVCKWQMVFFGGSRGSYERSTQPRETHKSRRRRSGFCPWIKSVAITADADDERVRIWLAISSGDEESLRENVDEFGADVAESVWVPKQCVELSRKGVRYVEENTVGGVTSCVSKSKGEPVSVDERLMRLHHSTSF